MARLPDLADLMAAQARPEEPPQVPSYLRQYTCPETTRARNNPLTYRDPTGERAVKNLEPKRKRRRQRRR